LGFGTIPSIIYFILNFGLSWVELWLSQKKANDCSPFHRKLKITWKKYASEVLKDVLYFTSVLNRLTYIGCSRKNNYHKRVCFSLSEHYLRNSMLLMPNEWGLIENYINLFFLPTKLNFHSKKARKYLQSVLKL
jgi:hypothetical protein